MSERSPYHIGWFRKMIVRAAPTCTLWRQEWETATLSFRLLRRWRITHLELAIWA